MTRSTVRGPGSNQHADKPPLAPAEPTAFTEVGAAVLDPFADESDDSSFAVPGGWITDLDAHNSAAIARQERLIADAQARIEEADARIAAADATMATSAAEARLVSRSLASDSQAARKEFFDARTEVKDAIAEKAAELGADQRWAEAAAEKNHVVTDPSSGMFELARRMTSDPKNFDGFARPEWDPKSNFTEDDWNTLVDHVHSSRHNQPALTDSLRNRMLKSAGRHKAAEEALGGFTVAKEAAETRKRMAGGQRFDAQTDLGNAKSRLNWMKGNAERGLPADMNTASTDDVNGLRRHAAVEPDGGTNAYVMRRNGETQRVMRFEPAGESKAGYGESVTSPKQTVAILDDGSRFSSAVRQTSRQRFGGTETLWFAPPSPDAQPATHPDGSPLGKMHAHVRGESWT